MIPVLVGAQVVLMWALQKGAFNETLHRRNHHRTFDNGSMAEDMTKASPLSVNDTIDSLEVL